jgi:hypothetical protein
MTMWTILAVLLLMAAAAPRYGADTRTSDNWTARPREHPTPATRASLRVDVRAAVALLAGYARRLRDRDRL